MACALCAWASTSSVLRVVASIQDTPTAQVTFAGRTGITTQDYDQTATITPKLGETLPVAGVALGGVGAGVGAAIWLVEQVVGSNVVESVAATKYELTGSWDNPKFEPVALPASEENDK